MLKFYILIIALLFSNNANAGFDGNQILKHCLNSLKDPRSLEGNELAGSMYCLGMIEGLNSTQRLQGAYKLPQIYCLPNKSLAPTQTARIIVKYLEDHPEELHEIGVGLAIIALMKAFPCKLQ